MLFPLEAWCPALGKGKGKEVGHQGNRLYSYSTYVLKSIHKKVQARLSGCRYAGAAAEKGISRKPAQPRSYSTRPCQTGLSPTLT
jgi:hypothetical protein